MKKLINNLPDYDVVMHHQTGRDEHAVLLARGGVYAVCKTQPQRRIATTPNYQANGYGLLSGPLTAAGLGDLLQWTDRDAAIERFGKLANLPSGVRLLHTTDPTG